MSLSAALYKGALDVKPREFLALAVAEFSGCDCCLAAHSHIGKHLVKLSGEQIAQARDGRAADVRNAAALRFAHRVAAERGRVPDAQIVALRQAGFSDAEAVEVVLHLALKVLTNYVNNVTHTDVVFPRVSCYTVTRR